MRLACVVLVVFVMYFSSTVAQTGYPTDPCSVHKNCSTCLYNDQPCGWCGSNGKCMTADPIISELGPDEATYGQKCESQNKSLPSGRWEYRTSKVLGDNNETDGILFPTEFFVYVRPGVPVNVTVRLIVPSIPPIDLLILQDASYSMLPLIETILSLVPNITSSLRQFTANSTACSTNASDCVYFGLSMYLEKPQMPYANFPESFIYKTVTSLTPDDSVFQKALTDSTKLISRNYEHPENGFEAMLYVSENSRLPGQAGFRYNKGVFHICMLVTDAGCHVAGEGKEMGIFTPNNGDGILDGFPPGTGEDYPTKEQVRQSLVNADVSPLFAADPRTLGFYEAIVNEWGIGAVVPLSASSDVVGVILNGTKEILSKATLSRTDDPLLRFDKFADPPGGTYFGVTGNQVLYFIITVLAPLELTEFYNQTSDIIIKYVGFGNRVTIHTYMNVTCVGCDPGNETAQVDICGICGGSDNCFGCDGILNSGLKFDACNQCGGRNQTCVGCDGVGIIGINGKSYDACGVCGGANETCIGCDGIPNSGKVWNTCTPPKCGGPCDEIRTTLIALGATVAIVGVIAAIAAIVLCVGSAATFAHADKMMLDEEARLQDNPLYEVARQRFDNPLYAPTDEL